MASKTVQRRGGWFLRTYLMAFAIAALIGLGMGVVWVLAGVLHFHPLW